MLKENKAFTVSLVTPNQVVLATPRRDELLEIPVVKHIPTQKAKVVDAPVVQDAYLCLECTLERVIDGFGDFSLIAGHVIAAFVREDALLHLSESRI